MRNLLHEIKGCKLCADFLPYGVNPVLRASAKSKLLIIGQAPGRVVHQTGIPWNDRSGDQLRKWLMMDRETFYDTDRVALMPMGFCYPGTGKSGDFPPSAACAPAWHQKLRDLMPEVKLTLLIGSFAQNHYLKQEVKKSLTENVGNFEQFLPDFFPLPHPSPRNRLWLRNNPWFEESVLPILQDKLVLI